MPTTLVPTNPKAPFARSLALSIIKIVGESHFLRIGIGQELSARMHIEFPGPSPVRIDHASGAKRSRRHLVAAEGTCLLVHLTIAEVRLVGIPFGDGEAIAKIRVRLVLPGASTINRQPWRGRAAGANRHRHPLRTLARPSPVPIPRKAYPPASGDPICSGAAAARVIEHTANTRFGSRGAYARFSPLAGRVSEPLRG